MRTLVFNDVPVRVFVENKSAIIEYMILSWDLSPITYQVRIALSQTW
jgi:hypothetical protein